MGDRPRSTKTESSGTPPCPPVTPPLAVRQSWGGAKSVFWDRATQALRAWDAPGRGVTGGGGKIRATAGVPPTLSLPRGEGGGGRDPDPRGVRRTYPSGVARIV